MIRSRSDWWGAQPSSAPTRVVSAHTATGSPTRRGDPVGDGVAGDRADGIEDVTDRVRPAGAHVVPGGRRPRVEGVEGVEGGDMGCGLGVGGCDVFDLVDVHASPLVAGIDGGVGVAGLVAEEHGSTVFPAEGVGADES